MEYSKTIDFLRDVLENMPGDWLNLTTHRLDIYNEELAKTEFVAQFEALFHADNASHSALSELRTAYDYIRLGHPLSCVLEWAIAKTYQLAPENVISFSSQTIPVLAVLRKNLLDQKSTRILYTDDLPLQFDADLIKRVYGYQFELHRIKSAEDISAFDGSTVFIARQSDNNSFSNFNLTQHIDFFVSLHDQLGSIILVNGEKNKSYTSEIQHVRRRETIAMTPANALIALEELIGKAAPWPQSHYTDSDKAAVLRSIATITGTDTKAVVASSGLSVQYAIVMGLIHEAQEKYPEKGIRIVVPPNCYGGTNDQARRVAACIDNVEVVDLPVDGGNDMVQSTNQVLDKIAYEDAIPYIIAEIPTNPRVEVPDMARLEEALSKTRKTSNGDTAISPVFILDQTFCPNVHFLRENDILSKVKTIAYISGSKFPSGGKCTAGYAVANQAAGHLMEKIALHLKLCDNEATSFQMEILAQQLPSMNQRIADAYRNTHEFVSFIKETLPTAKINFVSEDLATQGFTPSVFSLDLPTKGNTDEERETYKRALNLKLIDLMITEIPDESKYCVSYGQLKGCYWTIPATSTQGTTKEGDKDYIARVALSPDVNLNLHKKIFLDFVNSI